MADNRDDGRRQDVMAVLRERPAPMSITAIAERLDVRPNTVRFHLETLVASGQAELDPTMSVRDPQPFAEPDLCLTHLERTAAVPKAGPCVIADGWQRTFLIIAVDEHRDRPRGEQALDRRR